MKRSLRGRVAMLIIAFAVLLSGICIYINYENFVRANQSFSYSTARTVTETCNLIIDRDVIGDYIDTGRRTTEYYETWNKLIDYRNTNSDIIGLSLAWFDESGCHYVFDTELSEEGAFLGDVRDFDEKQGMHKEALINGEEIDFISYGKFMAVYQPVLSSYNLPLGYVIVEISTLAARQMQLRYLAEMTAVLTVLTLVLLLIVLYALNRTIIRPVNQLSEAAANYVSSMGEDTKESTLEQLSIHTGDEIERLFESVKKMKSDLLISANNLAVAQWNSHHDSMTGLYNKRYFYEYIQGYDKEKPAGIFFFDVDNLKKMNDIYGHEAGDEVICKTAEFVKKYQMKEGGGFRIGGDEFVLIAGGLDQESFYGMVAKMEQDKERELSPAGYTVRCRIAMGYAYAKECPDLEALVKLADQDMYQDKMSHRQ